MSRTALAAVLARTTGANAQSAHPKTKAICRWRLCASTFRRRDYLTAKSENTASVFTTRKPTVPVL